MRGRFGLAVLAGIAMALGTPPFDLWPLAIAGLCAACWLGLTVERSRLASTGWGTGLGYFGLSLNWIVEPFMVDAALTGWLAPFGVIGLAGGLSLFWGLAFWASGRVDARWRAVALVTAWSGAELARAYVLTGFPWGLLSYLWLESPAIQWVSVLGPHGLTVATLVLCACVGWAFCHRAWRILVLAGLGFGGLLGGGVWLQPAPQDLAERPVVRLIQPNAAQHEKWDPALIPVFFQRQITYTAAPASDGSSPALIVWPETALPMLLHRADQAMAQISAAAGAVPVVFGIQRAQDARYYNSMGVMNRQGQLAALYDKHHLVPFGEYMPARALWEHVNVAGLAARAEGGYAAGPGPQVLDFGPVLGRALPLICYEAVFPQDTRSPDPRADFLLQITNDAWFGEWSGPYQHLAQARIRAIEQGLPMVRAANTGVSAMIDPGGRITASLPLGEAGFVDAALPAPLRPTPYARFGDLPILLLLAAIGVTCLLSSVRESR